MFTYYRVAANSGFARMGVRAPRESLRLRPALLYFTSSQALNATRKYTALLESKTTKNFVTLGFVKIGVNFYVGEKRRAWRAHELM